MLSVNKTDVVPVLTEAEINFNTVTYVGARKEEHIMI